MRFRKQSQKQVVLAHLSSHTHKQTSLYYGIHLSMVYKWQYSRDKILSTNLKGIKPGAGRTSMHPLMEQQVHQEAMQERRDGICVTLAGIAQNMRLAVVDTLFKASSGWIKGYKRRHPCKLRVPSIMILASKWTETVDQDVPAKEVNKSINNQSSSYASILIAFCILQ